MLTALLNKKSENTKVIIFHYTLVFLFFSKLQKKFISDKMHDRFDKWQLIDAIPPAVSGTIENSRPI